MTGNNPKRPTSESPATVGFRPVFPGQRALQTHNPKVAGSNPAPATESPGQRAADRGFYRSEEFFSRVSTASSTVSTRAFVAPMTFGFLRMGSLVVYGFDLHAGGDAVGGHRVGRVGVAEPSVMALDGIRSLSRSWVGVSELVESDDRGVGAVRDPYECL